MYDMRDERELLVFTICCAVHAARFSGKVADVEHPDVGRVVRVHRNQVENLLPFVVLGAVWLVLGASAKLGSVLSPDEVLHG